MAIHSRDDAVIREFALKKPVFRIIANTQSSMGATGYTTGLAPSMSLGCGAYAGNITSDNITPLHLINVKRLAYELPRGGRGPPRLDLGARPGRASRRRAAAGAPAAPGTRPRFRLRGRRPAGAAGGPPAPGGRAGDRDPGRPGRGRGDAACSRSSSAWQTPRWIVLPDRTYVQTASASSRRRS